MFKTRKLLELTTTGGHVSNNSQILNMLVKNKKIIALRIGGKTSKSELINNWTKQNCQRYK